MEIPVILFFVGAIGILAGLTRMSAYRAAGLKRRLRTAIWGVGFLLLGSAGLAAAGYSAFIFLTGR